jgi:hypothetical protein
LPTLLREEGEKLFFLSLAPSQVQKITEESCKNLKLTDIAFGLCKKINKDLLFGLKISGIHFVSNSHFF